MTSRSNALGAGIAPSFGMLAEATRLILAVLRQTARIARVPIRARGEPHNDHTRAAPAEICSLQPGRIPPGACAAPYPTLATSAYTRVLQGRSRNEHEGSGVAEVALPIRNPRGETRRNTPAR